MAENNANNNQVDGPEVIIYPSSNPSIPRMFWKLITNTAHLILRFYLTFILISYHWVMKFVRKAGQPFEPIITQVQKVPKKDISVEGIFYQFLRLQFLILLYLTPFVTNAFLYLVQPLVWLKNWMEGYVVEEDDSWKKSDPTVLKEG